MTEILIQNKLTAPHEGKASGLYPLIASKTRRLDHDNALPAELGTLWTADWWGFQRCEMFAKLNENSRYEALAACNRTIMNEAYFIEKSGLAYCAKMILLAETTDVAQLYAHIAADEATHLAWIEPFVSANGKTNPDGQFLLFLSGMIEDYRPEILVYLVQIILEGWGLDHYKRLMKNCQDPALTEVFRRILKDEALHHHSGTILYKAIQFSDHERAILADAMKFYADLVRVGPLAAIAALDKVSGGMNLEDVVEVMAALDHPGESKRKLELLKNLMLQPKMESIVEAMDDSGYFTPYSPEEAAHYYLEHR
jgi:rubrerythrin